MEALKRLELPINGTRIVVQRTFVEVVDDLGTSVRRVSSAPVASSRGDEPAASKEGEDAESLDHPVNVAQQGKEAERQMDQEPKTTVAFRGIPLHFTRDQLMQHLDAWGFAGLYNFLYLPIDFSKRQNFGYAFVNMSSQEHARRTIAELDGASWCQPGEGKAVVSWSLTQGLDLHVERYRNSPVMHEAMLDQCKPIVLEGGVRVDFPPPTRKVQRLRRLRTRCGSRGRGVSSSGLSTVLGTEGHGVADAPGAPAVPCVLFPGLSSAPEGGAGKETDAVLASTLLAGLVPEAPDPRKSEALSECSASASASRSKKAAWADLQDDLNEGRSECSTQPPGYSSSTFSSDGSGCSTDGLAARWRGTGTSAQPWTGSILAGGLMPELPEEAGAQLSTGLPVLGSLVEVVGTYPSGAHAVIVATDHEEDTYTIQLTHNGCRTRRQRTVRCKHVRLLRHTEVGQLQ